MDQQICHGNDTLIKQLQEATKSWDVVKYLGESLLSLDGKGSQISQYKQKEGFRTIDWMMTWPPKDRNPRIS